MDLIFFKNDLSKPLRMESIDSSSGVLFPYYDPDTKLAFIAGKGDGNVRYYEIENEASWCHYLSQYMSGSPQRGLGFMPKRGLDVLKCEVFRFYKLHATKPLCEPISMIVPRKSEQFQDDLFPDTSAPTPALTAEEWLSGKNRNPILISLKIEAGARAHKPVICKSESNCMLTAARNNDYSNYMNGEPHSLPAHDSAGSDSEVKYDNEPKSDLDLHKAYKLHIGEIKLLKDQLQDKEKRIKDLEEQLRKLQAALTACF